MATKLSVNINKWATLRNARGGNNPDLLRTVQKLEQYGAQGITVHPRPDERHIKYQDARDLKGVITTEFNIEGNPISSFIDLVLEVRPTQVTLVPDAEDAITSDAGWDCKTHLKFLKESIALFKNEGIRTSIFLNADPQMVAYAAETGTDRIELYTEPYAQAYSSSREAAVRPFIETALKAQEFGLGLNAGHDLSLKNIAFFAQHIPQLLEVSIGHALICESIDFGLKTVVDRYLHALKNFA
ncbi:MAG: pyridoxine 5'-phosphate synthase [Bacteroidetes bacterium]|nr:pyridoxine 5'-phosphate synthase [Bacteroidota bacterium]MDA0950515.1 pyridoxine 5'-phosphate synthase [Bacteroidota bacterium]